MFITFCDDVALLLRRHRPRNTCAVAKNSSRIKPAFIPVTGLKCSYDKIFQPAYGDPEISVTEQARSSYEHIENFTNTGQPDQPSSCEEALGKWHAIRNTWSKATEYISSLCSLNILCKWCFFLLLQFIDIKVLSSAQSPLRSCESSHAMSRKIKSRTEIYFNRTRGKTEELVGFLPDIYFTGTR